MSTPAQIGKREYNDAIRCARNSNRETRKHLRRIHEETSSSLIRALVTSALLALGENEDAVNQLDEIGSKARNLDK